jgi:phosphatidylserine/phosphatidylglycerophosphate/cardiolipin synthase-like enzyme
MMEKYIFAFILLLLDQPGVCAEVSISSGFSPGGTALERVLQTINSAQLTADIAAYEFTSWPVTDALAAAAYRGVAIRLVADAGVNRQAWLPAHQLACAGIPVRLSSRYSIMHNKFIVTGNNLVETGSFNFTAATAKRNAENTLVIKYEPDIASQYQSEFNRLWDESVPLPCDRK